MYGKPLDPEELVVRNLGERRFPSPLRFVSEPQEGSGTFVPDRTRIRFQVELVPDEPPRDDLAFEKAGARRHLFFDPPRTRPAIVTCGGLCPGTNNVIRSVFHELYYRYGVKDILGIRYGFQGLNPRLGQPPLALTPELVKPIHTWGGTFLGSSRGAHDVSAMVDFLDRELGVDLLFTVGGDGTQRGTHALAEEVGRRGLPVAVVGIPKTIDNDVAFVWRTFGFYTALEKAREVIQGAHVEATGAPNGVGLVKLMGRDAGFIAAGATLASQEVNFTLIPEVPFALEGPGGFFEALEKRLAARGHAVVVTAEGAGQHLFPDEAGEVRDASGNLKHRDIGLLLRDRITEHFCERNLPLTLKYFDPSYLIRSVPANTDDALLSDALARHAVHAGMAGKTDVLVGHWHNAFIHVPIPAVISRRKRLDPTSGLWMSVLEATGQPARFGEPVALPG